MNKTVNVELSLKEWELLSKCFTKSKVVDKYNVRVLVAFHNNVESKLEDTINIVDDYLGEYGMGEDFEPNSLGVALETLKDKFIKVFQDMHDKN